MARRVALKALVELQNWVQIVELFKDPASPDEFIGLADAFYELGNKSELRTLLDSRYAADSTDVGVRQFIEIYRNRLKGI